MNRHRFSQLWIACLFFLPALAFAQALEKVVEGAKREGKVKVGITVRWMEGGKPGAKRMVELFSLAILSSRSITSASAGRGKGSASYPSWRRERSLTTSRF